MTQERYDLSNPNAKSVNALIADLTEMQIDLSGNTQIDRETKLQLIRDIDNMRIKLFAVLIPENVIDTSKRQGFK